MDTILTKLNELRKTWEIVGYPKSDPNFNTVSEWQAQKLESVLAALNTLLNEEESRKQKLKHSIASLKGCIESIAVDVGESVNFQPLESLDLISAETYLQLELAKYTKKHESLIKEICQAYEDMDLIRNRLGDATSDYFSLPEIQILLNNRLEVRFNDRTLFELTKIKDHLKSELVHQQVILKDLSQDLLRLWVLLNPKLEGLCEQEELLVKHMSSLNENYLWPKDWTFNQLKSALGKAQHSVESRKAEIRDIINFIQYYFDETGKGIQEATKQESQYLLPATEDLSLERLNFLREYKSRIEILRKEALEIELNLNLPSLVDLWSQLRIPQQFQDSFIASLKTRPTLAEIRSLCHEEKNRLIAQKSLVSDLLKTLDARTDLIAEMKDFELKASDPKRLFAPSFRLLYEEKFRKNAYPNLLKLEKKVMILLENYRNTFGNDFLNAHGTALKDSLEKEISERYLNETVFEFSKALATTPVVSEKATTQQKVTNGIEKGTLKQTGCAPEKPPSSSSIDENTKQQHTQQHNGHKRTRSQQMR